MSSRSHRKPSRTHGAFALGAVFLMLQAPVCFLLVFMPEDLQDRSGTTTLLSVVWISFFLGAIWFRQNWARYVLSTLLLASAVSAIFSLLAWPEAGESLAMENETEWVIFMGIYAAAQIAAACILIWYPPIRKMARHY
jgi:hypothetical protein